MKALRLLKNSIRYSSSSSSSTDIVSLVVNARDLLKQNNFSDACTSLITAFNSLSKKIGPDDMDDYRRQSSLVGRSALKALVAARDFNTAAVFGDRCIRLLSSSDTTSNIHLIDIMFETVNAQRKVGEYATALEHCQRLLRSTRPHPYPSSKTEASLLNASHILLYARVLNLCGVLHRSMALVERKDEQSKAATTSSSPPPPPQPTQPQPPSPSPPPLFVLESTTTFLPPEPPRCPTSPLPPASIEMLQRAITAHRESRKLGMYVALKKNNTWSLQGHAHVGTACTYVGVCYELLGELQEAMVWYRFALRHNQRAWQHIHFRHASVAQACHDLYRVLVQVSSHRPAQKYLMRELAIVNDLLTSQVGDTVHDEHPRVKFIKQQIPVLNDASLRKNQRERYLLGKQKRKLEENKEEKVDDDLEPIIA